MTKRGTEFSDLGRRIEAPAISWLMELRLKRPHLISLAAGFTDSPSLPIAETRALVEELLSSPRSGRIALQYGSTPGDPELRQLTAARLLKQDEAAYGKGGSKVASIEGTSTAASGPYSPERTLITHGSQQLLYMIAEALCDPGDIALVEDPTYLVFLSIAQSRGMKCRGVRLENDGLDLAHLEEVLEGLRRSGELKRVKLLYLVSYVQNPSGVSASFAKKTAALKLLRKFERAAGHPIYLVEDAAYRELRFAGADVPSALAVRGFEERVVYTGTYSKPFATGVRVGFGVLPAPVLEVVTHIKGNHDFGTSTLLQRVLARAIASCRYETHLAGLHERYARKAAVLASVLRDHLGSVLTWDEPQGGLYIWARAKSSVRTGVKSSLFKSALAGDVLYVPGALCYCDDPARSTPDNEMRLSFGNASEEEMREGIRRLARAMRGARVA